MLHLNFLGCTYLTFCVLRQNLFFLSFENQGACCQLGPDRKSSYFSLALTTSETKDGGDWL